MTIKICKLCTTPSSRPRIIFDNNGVCNACNNSKEKKKIDWEKRRKEFEKICNNIKSTAIKLNNQYDCIVPWSGGKDSTSIALKLKFEFGLRPLLVTNSPLIPNEVGTMNREMLLEKGFDSWIEKSRLIGHVSRMDADEFSILIENKSTTIVDVRKASEFQSQHILWSQNIPLNSIEKSISSIPRDRPFVLICVGGYRSMIAASILKKNGIHNFVDIRGGFDAIKETPISLSNYQTPTTQL